MTETLQTHAPSAPRNGLGIASLVLGLIALITSVLMVGLLFGTFAVVLGSFARDSVIRGEATNRRTAIAAMVLGVVAIIISLVALAFRIWLIS
jgi:Domain of unknown function (DUF4190)